MKKLILITILLFQTSVYAGMRAGVWVEEISPNETEMTASCLGGYGSPFSRCGSTDVLDGISVRALSIFDHDTSLTMLVFDTVGMGDQLIEDIKDRVTTYSYGYIDRDSIKVISTHTHAGPDLQGLWGGVAPEYRERIIERAATAAVISKFFSFSVDVSVSKTVANVENRRGWEEVDSDVNVLRFTSKHFNHTIATLVNMSAHPTILDETNMGYSAGYIHFLRKEIEENVGGKVVFVNGILGDAQPNTLSVRGYQEAEAFGLSVANNVINSFDSSEPVKPNLKQAVVDFNHVVANPNVIGAAQAGLLDLQLNEDNSIDTQFTYFKIGDKVSGIGFPGEALSRLGLPLKEEMTTPYKFFFGLYDDSYGYFIPSDEFLQIDGRFTEEAASMGPFIGDASKAVVSELINR